MDIRSADHGSPMVAVKKSHANNIAPPVNIHHDRVIRPASGTYARALFPTSNGKATLADNDKHLEKWS